MRVCGQRRGENTVNRKAKIKESWAEVRSGWKNEGKRQHGGQVDVPYLALHQHSDVYKHVVQLFDAALQADDVLVSRFDLTQGLFGNAGVHDLRLTTMGGKYGHTQQGQLRPRLTSHTPAVKTAAFPLSNISSSSSSVVAFPAERRSEVNAEKRGACPPDETDMYVGVTHWSPAVSGYDLYSSPWSPPGLRYTWSLPPQTFWTGQHARTRPEKGTLPKNRSRQY